MHCAARAKEYLKKRAMYCKPCTHYKSNSLQKFTTDIQGHLNFRLSKPFLSFIMILSVLIETIHILQNDIFYCCMNLLESILHFEYRYVEQDKKFLFNCCRLMGAHCMFRRPLSDTPLLQQTVKNISAAP